jgi:hypothetical protein
MESLSVTILLATPVSQIHNNRMMRTDSIASQPSFEASEATEFSCVAVFSW